MDTPPSVAYRCQFGELREIRGVVMLRDGNIVLEYQTQDGFVGVFKSVLITRTIPLAEIESFDFSSSWFGWFSKLTLRTRSMQTMTEIAGADQNRMVLWLVRSERKHAQDLSYHVRMALSERTLKQLETSPATPRLDSESR